MKYRKYYYTNKRLKSLTIDDYLNLLHNVEEHNRKGDNITYKAQCPLKHNHPNNDQTSSFVISKGDKVEVVYTCMSQGGPKGKCNQKALTDWFINQFKKNKILQSEFPLGYDWHKKFGRHKHEER